MTTEKLSEKIKAKCPKCGKITEIYHTHDESDEHLYVCGECDFEWAKVVNDKLEALEAENQRLQQEIYDYMRRFALEYNTRVETEAEVKRLTEEVRCNSVIYKSRINVLESRLNEAETVYKTIICKKCVRPDRPCICDIAAERFEEALGGDVVGV